MTRLHGGRSAFWRTAWVRLFGACALAVVVSTPAFAQDPTAGGAAPPPGMPDIPLPDGIAQPLGPPDVPPPDDAVRPPVVAKPEPRHLNLNMSLFDAYDLASVKYSIPQLGDPRLEQNTSFSGLNASLSYAQLGQNKSFSAMTGADLRYYSLSPDVLPVDYFGGLNFSSTVSRHVAIHGSGTASYSPFYTFGNFLTPVSATQIPTPQPDQNIAQIDTLTAAGSGGLIWSPTRYTSIDMTYGADYTDTPIFAYRIHDQSAGAAFRHRMTRYSELHLGYTYRTSNNGLQAIGAFVAQDINVGFGYHRPLSFSRRTVVGFNVGSTVVSQAGVRSFYVTGDASLSYQMSRTWVAAISGHRDVSTFGGSFLPYVSDVVSGSIAGLVTRHVSFDASGGYSHGSSAVGITNAYNAVTGSTSLHFTLSRYLPVYVQYVYYFYRFDEAIGLAAAFPVTTNRSGVRAGLSYSLPLIGQRVPRS